MCVSRCSSYGLTAYRDRRLRDPIRAATPGGATRARTTFVTSSIGCDGNLCGRGGRGRSGNIANRSGLLSRARTTGRGDRGGLVARGTSGRTATCGVGTWREGRAGETADGGGANLLGGGTVPSRLRTRSGLIGGES
jgi:hypothetical protein